MNELILTHLKTEEELVELVGKYLVETGGKRIRPLLTILSSKIFGHDSEDTIKLATAVEFIHAATILHDDVVDGSRLRRFKPSANVVWGNKASILVGDFLFSQSFKLMVSTNSLEALKSLSNASAIIAEGEVSQLAKLNEQRIISQKEYHSIIAAKTSELFGAACEMGSIIAMQPSGTSKLIKQFGINLGNIFQITDDLLDYFGEDKKLGKNKGADFLEGKVTLPLILLYEAMNLDEKRKIDKMIKAPERSEEDFLNVLKMLDNYKIKNQIMVYLSDLRTETNLILNQIHHENESKVYLSALIDFAINRSY